VLKGRIDKIIFGINNRLLAVAAVAQILFHLSLFWEEVRAQKILLKLFYGICENE